MKDSGVDFIFEVPAKGDRCDRFSLIAILQAGISDAGADGLRPSTLVLLQNLLQNRIFHLPL
jgi:hypothetical protein